MAVPVKASSFSQADRKEEKKRDERGRKQKVKLGQKKKGSEGQKGRVVSILLKKAQLNMKFQRWTTHAVNVSPSNSCTVMER